jgi:hypothetical protein
MKKCLSEKKSKKYLTSSRIVRLVMEVPSSSLVAAAATPHLVGGTYVASEESNSAFEKMSRAAFLLSASLSLRTTVSIPKCWVKGEKEKST